MTADAARDAVSVSECGALVVAVGGVVVGDSELGVDVGVPVAAGSSPPSQPAVATRSSATVASVDNLRV
jgi:hypothetical protein